jgi:hypothetical protein
MNQPTPIVSFHPYFKVQPGQLDVFRELLRACIEKTRAEPKCLSYDFTRNDHVVFCREAYVGAEGALAHLGNVTPLLGELLKISELVRLEVHGPAAELDQMRAPLAAMNPAWFVSEFGLERKW